MLRWRRGESALNRRGEVVLKVIRLKANGTKGSLAVAADDDNCGEISDGEGSVEAVSKYDVRGKLGFLQVRSDEGLVFITIG